MGLLDNVTSALNRSAAAAGRTSNTMKLKLQLNDLVKQRRELAAQLGASLYESVKDNEALREGREMLFDGIAQIDVQRAQIEAQMNEIESEAEAAREAARLRTEAAQTLTCPNCGTKVLNSYAFCTGCGKPIEEIRAEVGTPVPAIEPAGRVCVSCGAPLQDDDLFCVSCGMRQPESNAPSEEDTI